MEDFTKKFNDSFLVETPEKILVGKSMFSNILYDIGELLNSDIEFVKLNKKLASIELSTVAYFWHYSGEDRDDLDAIQVAVSMNKTGYNYTVSQVGKRPGTNLTPASLYLDILDSGKVKNIRLTSDKAMSVGGLNVWKEILKKHKVSYYDSENPSALISIENEHEMESLFGVSTPEINYSRFQYVLSESKLEYLNSRALFSLRETRRLAGYPESLL
jgi:hypothetical protein